MFVQEFKPIIISGAYKKHFVRGNFFIYLSIDLFSNLRHNINRFVDKSLAQAQKQKKYCFDLNLFFEHNTTLVNFQSTFTLAKNIYLF